MKKLSFELQPYHEVVQLIEEIRGEFFFSEREEMGARTLISYALLQFGDRIRLIIERALTVNLLITDGWR
jgi:hypothetical protein